MFLILFLGAMAAFALSEYRFPGNTVLGLYMALGIMIPIRLGTVAILRLVVAMGLINTLAGADPGLHGHGAAADHLHPAAIHAPGASGAQGCRAHRRRQ